MWSTASVVQLAEAESELHCAWKPLSIVPTRYTKLLLIYIWDAHMHVGWSFVSYTYTGQYTHTGQNMCTQLRLWAAARTTAIALKQEFIIEKGWRVSNHTVWPSTLRKVMT